MQRFKLSFLANPLMAFALVLAPACGGDDGGGDENNDTGGTDDTTASTTMTSTTMTSTTMTSTTMTSTTMTSTTDNSTETTDDPTETTDDPTTDTTVDSSGTDDGPTTGGGDVCAPEGDDTECVACTKEMCCTQLSDCAADEGCGCTLECLGMLENPGFPEAMMCASDCGADFVAISPLLIAVQMCRDSMCMEDCGA